MQLTSDCKTIKNQAPQRGLSSKLVIKFIKHSATLLVRIMKYNLIYACMTDVNSTGNCVNLMDIAFKCPDLEHIFVH